MGTPNPMSPIKRAFVARVFPLAIVLVGAGALYLGLEDTIRARASVDWPSVDGTVVRSNVERVVGSSSGGSASGRSVTYRVQVVCEYSVDGKARKGNRISYGHHDTAAESDAARVVANCPAGKRVKVRYQPGNPGEAVLEPGSGGLPWFYLALGSVFLLVGVMLAVLVPKFVAKST